MLATASWDEFRGFFSISLGQKLLVAAVALACVCLACALISPASAIFPARGSRVRMGLLGVIGLLSAIAALRPAALIDGLAANPVIGTVIFVTKPLADARAAVNGKLISKVPFGASRSATREVHILVIGESARRDYPAYRQAHPDKVQAIIANADKEIRTHNVFYSLADVMGIQWPGATASQSFASPDFVPDSRSPYIAGGTLVTLAN